MRCELHSSPLLQHISDLVCSKQKTSQSVHGHNAMDILFPLLDFGISVASNCFVKALLYSLKNYVMSLLAVVAFWHFNDRSLAFWWLCKLSFAPDEPREQYDEDLFTSMLEIICYEEVPGSIRWLSDCQNLGVFYCWMLGRDRKWIKCLLFFWKDWSVFLLVGFCSKARLNFL